MKPARSFVGAALAAIAGVVLLNVLADVGVVARLFWLVEKVPGQDTTGHVVVYALLSFLVNLGLADARPFGRRIGVAGCTALLVVAVTAEEYSQKLFAARHFDLTDLTASLAGTLGAALAAWWFLRNRRA